MPTLIAVYNSDGCVGRCDASCYNAVLPRCRCVCGGVNHGIGLDQARANTKEITDEQFAGKGAWTVIREQIQSTLF